MKLEKYLPGILLFLTIVLLISINHLPVAKADAAPMPGAIASDLYPSDSSTKVRMESETVILEIADTSDFWSGHANVTATFYMRNMGEETESMTVRFPMNHSEYNLIYELETGKEDCHYSEFPSIENFSAYINDSYVVSTISSETMVPPEMFGMENPIYLHFNCWAHFDVTFPPGEEVRITVKYKVPAYNRSFSSIVGNNYFNYILKTGAGWYDTIGEADICFRFPYEVNDLNFRYCNPEDCSIVGNDITYHYENFEPEKDLEINVVKATIWSQVVKEESYLQDHPDDGEAWGRLGKAYKAAIRDGKGFIFGYAESILFNRSLEAYQKALERLPNDIEWHYGYAELVCEASMFQYFEDDDYSRMILQECNEQLKIVLDRDPDHEDTLDLLEMVRNWTKDRSGDIAEFLVLTPMPSNTQTPVPSSTKPFLTATRINTWTPAPTKTKCIATNTPTPSLESYESSNTNQNRLIFSIGANILMIALFFFAIPKDRPNK